MHSLIMRHMNNRVTAMGWKSISNTEKEAIETVQGQIQYDRESDDSDQDLYKGKFHLHEGIPVIFKVRTEH